MTKSRKESVLVVSLLAGTLALVLLLVVVVISAFSASVSSRNAGTINLKDNLNAKFTESVLARGGNGGPNNLASFPQGLRHFGGTLFNVEGIVQLSSLHLRMERKHYPERVNGIKVARQCCRLHLLHGAGWDDRDGKRIAELVLHYADGSQRELNIIFGEHVRCWWGPPSEKVSGPDARMVWTGSNPVTRQRGAHLRIYKTTFQNPQPNVKIETIDYASMMANAAPFLIALTVE